MPRRVHLDVVDPPAVPVVGAQHRRVGVGQPGVLAGLGRADELRQRGERRQGVARTLAVDRVGEGGIAGERVEAGKRGG